MSKKEEIVRVEDMPKWDWDNENLVETEMIPYYNQGMSSVMLSLARFMYEIGFGAYNLQQKASYGDNAIKSLAKGIHRGDSWMYECIKMYVAYSWEDIQGRLLMAGIPPSSIQRLGCITDDGARSYVEDKLVSGEITYEDITKTKKEYETIVSNPDVSHDQVGAGPEPSIAEQTASSKMDPDDPNNVAASIIRSHFGKLERLAEEQMLMMEDTLVAHDKLGDISDTSLYNLSQQRIVETGIKLKQQITYLQNIVETVSKLAPQEFTED